MDAAALLKSQGWRGKGFSLHPTNNNVGLAKPLLIKRNTDGRGVGQKPHHTSDQWWLHAFDEKLKGLDTSVNGVVQSVTRGKLDAVAKCSGNLKYTGLYTSFIRGETMKGTITPDSADEESTDATPQSEDRELPRIHGETKEERRARRAAKRLKRDEKAARKAVEAKAARKEKVAKKEAKQRRKTAETRDERRARQAERRARKEARRKRDAAERNAGGC